MKFRFCGDLDCPDWVLAEVATLSKLTSIRTKILAVQILGYCIAGAFNYDKVLKIAKDNADGLADLKGSIAAVHFIVANAAKHDLDEASLVQEIQQLGLPKENSDAIGRQYREHKDQLRSCLADQSYRVAGLISVDWRADLTVTSSVEDAPLQPTVHLKLRLDSAPERGPLPPGAEEDGEGRVKEVAFEMGADKLDVLVQELGQALTLMEA
mmetsp:Transcript_15742/g.26274  ORF Transcript_15742/g.26274 Transcript_15742/m.26274 type:complete len:211 (+) Transcript_15742:75-707(+)|eukprot:CAMPEP_0114418404 /NCGR_PEP_ID=MMETSP0103-20121206/3477_1 /TAXON_ID=37642 ORGANISM="Paraphysomonas imperforata, Strain PA2" /NCGR_SAMPLE_ID=MMETSP0103 /ASSEMBLY_ACC=CAM_ASM_000201 /LENGTH=210 /DNA_ID=CAMNT_0001586757 /DNA_START=38 /DNA_END=670 /DNA_ORIENTATION=+